MSHTQVIHKATFLNGRGWPVTHWCWATSSPTMPHQVNLTFRPFSIFYFSFLLKNTGTPVPVFLKDMYEFLGPLDSSKTTNYFFSVLTLVTDVLIKSQTMHRPLLPAPSHKNRQIEQTGRERQLAWGLRFVLLCFVASVLSLVYSHTHKESDFHSPLAIWVFALVLNLPYRALLSSASAYAWPRAANYNCHYIYSSFWYKEIQLIIGNIQFLEHFISLL